LVFSALSAFSAVIFFMDNIAAHVPLMARRQPQTLAIVQPTGKLTHGQIPYRHFTFRELDRASPSVWKQSASAAARAPSSWCRRA